MFSNITVDDYGWVIEITLKQDDITKDVSSYQGILFVLLDPSGKETVHMADFVNDGRDGKVDYTVEDGDIDEVGVWKLRCRLTKTGVEITSEPVQFRVSSRK